MRGAAWFLVILAGCTAPGDPVDPEVHEESEAFRVGLHNGTAAWAMNGSAEALGMSFAVVPTDGGWCGVDVRVRGFSPAGQSHPAAFLAEDASPMRAASFVVGGQGIKVQQEGIVFDTFNRTFSASVGFAARNEVLSVVVVGFHLERASGKAGLRVLIDCDSSYRVQDLFWANDIALVAAMDTEAGVRAAYSGVPLLTASAAAAATFSWETDQRLAQTRVAIAHDAIGPAVGRADLTGPGTDVHWTSDLTMPSMLRHTGIGGAYELEISSASAGLGQPGFVAAFMGGDYVHEVPLFWTEPCSWESAGDC